LLQRRAIQQLIVNYVLDNNLVRQLLGYRPLSYINLYTYFQGVDVGKNSARAVLYFEVRWKSVDMDIVEQLAERGSDIIFVEKNGIVEVQVSYADEYGIALVNRFGRLTEYGKDLIEGA
jgi:hypothetical protein